MATTTNASRNYAICMEVAGPLALFARPDTGGAPVSYPVPTRSAAKGLFDAIAFYADGAAWIAPTRVEVCRRKEGQGGAVRFESYVTNYGGPLRKSDQLAKDNNLQLFATALYDVCYRLHGEVRGERQRGSNPRHALYDMFVRRLEKGQCFRTPSLGWKEFTCTYWGPPREGWVVDDALDFAIPSMLSGMWSAEVAGRYAPAFVQDARVDRGVLKYR